MSTKLNSVIKCFISASVQHAWLRYGLANLGSQVFPVHEERFSEMSEGGHVGTERLSVFQPLGS
jgi:hypothetical protein